MKRVLVLILAAMPHSQAAAQPADRLAFEVASIKPHKELVTFSRDPSIHGPRVTGTASTLLDFITVAYAVRYDQITEGPGWADSEHYDLDAKAEESERPLRTTEMRRMLQTLLADRFRLAVHRETVEAAMYALVVAKNGPKLKPVAADATGGGSVRSDDRGNHMETTKGTMAQLAAQLSYTAGHPVLDRTGLEGYYAYTLDWYPANRTAPSDPDVPDMFHALQEQLGLKLEATRGPAEKLVIDRAEKPSEN